jgi:hypothetical protein
VGCANYYTLLFMCPIIYLNYFLVHKISIYKYIYEIRKKKWKKEKEREFSASWAGGMSAQRARARAGSPAGPRRSGVARADAVGAGPRISVRRGGNDVERATEGGDRSGSTIGEVRGSSLMGARFCDKGVVARHGRG